ncbi:eRF1 domain 1-domain-containing protein [Apodospora peruviana]|uniref:Protein DOM34 homolog n=1 Tax=Apodospora peruviana TaxID=516989 RepID=A0AAE0HVJ8_9PEZI|nr:eRF1 domain 1-domain-containing protein [Apodospora peruviana]
MRFVSKKQTLEAIDAETAVALLPVEPEDMWHANNLIAVGDIVKAHAIRKVTQTSSTGSTLSERVHTDLTIRVTSTFFDPAASALHVSGTVVRENAFVNIGQHHTLDLELNRPFTIWKSTGWDSVALQTLQEALNDDKPDALVAVVMQAGFANICLISEFQTVIKQRVESSVPAKRLEGKDKSEGMKGFYEKTLSTLLRAVDFSTPRPLLLASPGFVAQDFRAYIQSEGARRADKRLQRIAKDAVVVHSTTGHVYALNEVLKSPEVQATMRDKKFTNETSLMDQFFDRMRRDDGRAWYGAKPVEKAVMEGAVGRGGGVLLINNAFFRSMDIPTRKRYVALVDKVKEDGGEAKVLSSDHESGQRLDSLGGIAAILTYPIFDLDEDDDDQEGEADAGDGAAGTMVI